MASRERTTSIKCAEPACNDYAYYRYRSQREYAEIHASQKKHPYECTRHRNRHEVLSSDNPERTQVLVASKVDGVADRLFWIPEGGANGSGFTFGPGYKAHADDFPEGTRLIVTARIEICAPPASTTEETTPMPETRAFHLGDILSITTECLLSPSGVSGVQKILDWMTGDKIYTHQIPRSVRECAPHLLKQHPDLADIAVPEFGDDAQTVLAWLDEQTRRFGETRPVTRLHPDDHTRIDPLTELQMIAPHVPLISVEIPPTEETNRG